LLGLSFIPEYGGDMFLQNIADFNRLHSIISQKTELFVTTSVRTSVRTTSKLQLLININLYLDHGQITGKIQNTFRCVIKLYDDITGNTQLSGMQASVEAHRVVRGRGSHIF
jgi:hypothetical protein